MKLWHYNFSNLTLSENMIFAKLLKTLQIDDLVIS